MYNTIDRTIKNTMNNIVSANELKTKGISAVESLIKKEGEVLVSVRGKEKYAIISSEKLERLREYELSVALAETEVDLKRGKYREESVEKHLKRVVNG